MAEGSLAIDKLSAYPNTKRIVDEVLSVWPEHLGYCEARFRADDDTFERRMDETSGLILKNVGDQLRLYCQDYRWMCEEFLNEEIHFRRTGAYRLSTFEEAYREVYSDPNYMGRYVRGILISQLIWEPHARAFDFFRTTFLPRLPENGEYLEVGPGHGLFLYYAAQAPNLARLEAWDVSQSSIAETRAALKRLGVTRDISIVEQDVLKAPSRHAEFDGAVISEVLEHLERPELALRSLHAALRPGGRIFINAPINSPAPDHIYLWETSESLVQMIEAQGFVCEETRLFPVTGATIENAVRKQLSVSVIVIGRKT
jgi:2-polyprenyl-3-methyl-5-hydroxy-6-metoxy-1,4-benzoquinol methylase